MTRGNVCNCSAENTLPPFFVIVIHGELDDTFNVHMQRTLTRAGIFGKRWNNSPEARHYNAETCITRDEFPLDETSAQNTTPAWALRSNFPTSTPGISGCRMESDTLHARRTFIGKIRIPEVPIPRKILYSAHKL